MYISAPNYTCDMQLNELLNDLGKKIAAHEESLQKGTKVPAHLSPARILQNGPATLVTWEDGEQTVVKLCPEDKKDASLYVAFCIALAKRVYGTNSALHRAVDKHDDTFLQAEALREKTEKREAQLALEARNHERKVRAEAKRLKILQEACKLLEKGEEG